MSIQVEIVTPQKTAYSGEATEVQAPGFLGEFGVLPDHTFFLSVMRPGTVTVFTADGPKRFLVGRGFAEAGPAQLTLLTEVCETEVDRAAAEQALRDAEAALMEHEAGTGPHAVARHAADLAAARIAFAG